MDDVGDCWQFGESYRGSVLLLLYHHPLDVVDPISCTSYSFVTVIQHSWLTVLSYY